MIHTDGTPTIANGAGDHEKLDEVLHNAANWPKGIGASGAASKAERASETQARAAARRKAAEQDDGPVEVYRRALHKLVAAENGQSTATLTATEATEILESLQLAYPISTALFRL